MSEVAGFTSRTGVRLIVAGSRGITNVHIVAAAIQNSGYVGTIAEIVCGCAKGVDSLGEAIAKASGIPVKYFPADWQRYRRAAGPIRNEAMGHYADAAVIVREDGIASRGATSMLKVMKSLGKPVHLKEV